MQVVGARTLALNRRHPDARGLVLAHPLNVQRSDGFRDATGKDGSKWAYSGGLALSSFGTWAGGYGISGNGTLGQKLLSPLSQQTLPAGSDFTFIAQCRLDSAAAFQIIMLATGIAFGFQAGQLLSVYGNAGGVLRSSALAATLGAKTVWGVRYKNSATAYQFFLNGQFDTPTVGTAPTYSAQTPYLGGGIAGSGGWNGIMSDVRLYNRYMPNDTFMRAYRQPLGIYIPTRAWTLLLPPSGAAGRFLPFLHPAF